MQVACIDENGIASLYYKSELISPLNEPLLSSQGLITEESEEKIISHLRALKLAGELYGSTHTKAIATELFRKAPNGLEIANRISKALDMVITVITPREEGILSFLTIVHEANIDPKNLIVLDIGSGSFQITYKIGTEFYVYSLPYGRLPTYELAKANKLSDLSTAISQVDPNLLEKIQNSQQTVIGIGAHPKLILNVMLNYNLSDVEKALSTHQIVDINHSDLQLVETIMKSLTIEQIHYVGGRAGNTTGMFFHPQLPI